MTFYGSRISAILMLFTLSGGLLKSMAYEEPKYKVLKEYDEFEIREYESFIVAETEVDGNLESASDKAFRILFDYISGNNIKQEEIEMTIPVNQSNSEAEGEKIEMTTPVTQTPKLNGSGKFAVSFVVPSKYSLENVPAPKDPRVVIRQIEKRKVAVRKYSGSWSEDNYRENEKILIEELKREKIKTVGEPIYARYNPPFWPWFLRRNEVMVEVEY